MNLTVRDIEQDEYAGLEHLCGGSRLWHGWSVWSAPSFAAHLDRGLHIVGAYKGDELVGGGTVYLADGRIQRIVDGVPWSGLFARSADEGENLAIAEVVAGHLLGRYGEVALTLHPDWRDVRAFTWLGLRTHVRYTYSGIVKYRHDDRYEKRMRLRECEVGKVESDHGSFSTIDLATGDSEVTFIHDKPRDTYYYWKANRGGTWHSELIDCIMRLASVNQSWVDLVGCNSPTRSLFKRAFGLPLRSYYHISSAPDIPAVFLPVAA